MENIEFLIVTFPFPLLFSQFTRGVESPYWEGQAEKTGTAATCLHDQLSNRSIIPGKAHPYPSFGAVAPGQNHKEGHEEEKLPSSTSGDWSYLEQSEELLT